MHSKNDQRNVLCAATGLINCTQPSMQFCARVRDLVHTAMCRAPLRGLLYGCVLSGSILEGTPRGAFCVSAGVLFR